MPNPSQEPPVPSKAPNEDLKDMDLLCTFKIKIESQNLAYGCTKYQWPYPNQYQDAKPQSGTSSVLQSPKSGLKCHGCYLHLQNQDREPKFGIWSTKDQWPYPNQYQDAKPQSGTPYPNQDKIPNFSQEHPVSSKGPYHDLRDMVVFMSSKSR